MFVNIIYHSQVTIQQSKIGLYRPNFEVENTLRLARRPSTLNTSH